MNDDKSTETTAELCAAFFKPRTSLEVATYFDGGGEYFPECYAEDLLSDDAGNKAATLIAVAAIRSPVARNFVFEVLDVLADVYAPECQGWANDFKEFVDSEIESAFYAYDEERAQLEDDETDEDD